LVRHIAIYISNNDDKSQLIEDLVSGNSFDYYLNLKGSVFSETTLNSFIEEEIRHGHFNVHTDHKNSLEKSSEGERKKALLEHLISANPEYLIVDNVFGNLDINSQDAIVKTLRSLSKKTPIIQITNRKGEILDFINKTYQVQGKDLVLFDNILKQKIKKTFMESLPRPYKPITTKFNPLIKFNNVNVIYGDRTIIKDICWEIKAGEFWQLVGPNGSGKSTILSLISGDNPKAFLQDITLFGVKKGSGESVWDIKKKIGYFSSELMRGFKRSDSIENMVLSGFYDSIGLYKFPTDTQIILAHQWLHLLGMFGIKDKSFLSLSIGHQRLVLISRAMVKHPPLLILDEPTNGLDDNNVELFSELINKIAAETETAILYVSHRKEAGVLKPDFIYELTPNVNGSKGSIAKN
jgi:molybdate transport system ATP-binding protein